MKHVLKDSAQPSLLTNTEKALLALELLYVHGCTVLVVSPGSRSTPLTVLAARDERFEKVVVHDERAAGGFALGVARATGKPAALICTSGSAVANYYPAIVEASADELPLFVVSADRPAYLHGTGANQTMFQYDMFGDYVASNRAEAQFSTAKEYAQHLVSVTPNVAYGPVHINIEFDKPLEPSNVETAREHVSALIESCDREYSEVEWHRKRGWYEEKETGTLEFLETNKQQIGAVIIGRLATKQQVEIALSIAIILECPVHVDVTAHCEYSHLFELVARWDISRVRQRDEKFHAPMTVVHIGGKCVECEQTREILQQAETCIHVTPFRSVVHHGTAQHRVFEMPEYEEIECVATRLYSRIRPQALLHRFLPPTGRLAEVLIVKRCISTIYKDDILWLASSMTIRYAQALENHVHSRVLSNRGVSGIDMTIASACGASFATKSSVTCVLGDMAFLHDCNSLSLMRISGVNVHLEVINNNVGGIFHRLPIAQEKDVFEPYFLTPTQVDVAALADAFAVGERVEEHNTQAHESLNDIAVARDFVRYEHQALDLPFEEVGTGPKHIVFLHGFAGSSHDWFGIAEHLGDQFTCIIPDLHTPVAPHLGEGWSFVAYSASLSMILRDRNIKSYGVVGYSMGGRLARYWQQVATNRADWMLLESSHPGLESFEERMERVRADENIARKLELCRSTEDLRAFFEAWYANPLFGALRQKPGFEKTLERRCLHDGNVLAQSLRRVGLGQQPHLDLDLTQCRTELVVGRLDAKFLSIATQEHKEHGVPIAIAENVSHNVHSEDPEYFVANIMNIVESVWSE